MGSSYIVFGWLTGGCLSDRRDVGYKGIMVGWRVRQSQVWVVNRKSTSISLSIFTFQVLIVSLAIDGASAEINLFRPIFSSSNHQNN